MTMRFSWTKGEDRQLQGLLNKGWTYQQIANVMGASRSAVAGRIHRLALEGPRSDPGKAHHVGRSRM